MGMVGRPPNRTQFNTKVRNDVLMEFKGKCTLIGIDMSVIIEALMREFNDNEYTIMLSEKGVKLIKEKTDNSEKASLN